MYGTDYVITSLTDMIMTYFILADDLRHNAAFLLKRLKKQKISEEKQQPHVSGDSPLTKLLKVNLYKL